MKEQKLRFHIFYINLIYILFIFTYLFICSMEVVYGVKKIKVALPHAGSRLYSY